MWKLEGKSLKNKANLWNSDDEWKFKIKDMMIYVENTNNNKVLAVTQPYFSKFSKVIEEDFVEGNTEQLWKKGKPNAEGYCTLENHGLRKTLTAISANSLQVRGKSQHLYHSSINKLGQ